MAVSVGRASARRRRSQMFDQIWHPVVGQGGSRQLAAQNQTCINLFKGCHEIFDLYFFMIWTHLRPWQTGWSIFEFFFDFIEIFDHKVVSEVCSKLQSQHIFLCKSTFYTSNIFFHDRCVHPLKGFLLFVPLKTTRDKRRFQSPVCSLSLRCDARRGDCLDGVMHTAESDSAVWCTPRRLTPCRDCLCRVMHSADFFWDIVFLTPEKFGTIDSTVWCM